jgi:hypothetical protein
VQVFHRLFNLESGRPPPKTVPKVVSYLLLRRRQSAGRHVSASLPLCAATTIIERVAGQA